MRRRSGLAALSLLALSVQSAAAFEPLDAAFQVSFEYAGQEHRLALGEVPLLPGGACYAWWLQVPRGTLLESVSERLLLPAAATNWGGLDSDPNDGVEVLDGGALAVSTLPDVPDAQGWLSNNWCVGPGDPTGPYRIEVSANGAVVETFDFEVVLPEDFSWPTIEQPDPSARSVHQSW